MESKTYSISEVKKLHRNIIALANDLCVFEKKLNNNIIEEKETKKTIALTLKNLCDITCFLSQKDLEN